jgi:hypothetical protein
MHGPLLPWAFIPLSGFRSRLPPVSTSGAFPPGLFAGSGAVSAAFRGLHQSRVVPVGVLGGGRLVVPAGVPIRIDSLYEVLAPFARRRRRSTGRAESHRLNRPILSACRRDGTSKRGLMRSMCLRSATEVPVDTI